MQLRLMYRDPIGETAAPPPACPHADCGSGRLRLRQTVAKAVRPVHTEQPAAVVAHRYTCLGCGRTFRAYPAGVDRGQVAVGIKHLAAALHLLGLSFRDASLALTALNMPLGKSQAQAAGATIIGDVRAAGIAPLFTRVGVGFQSSGFGADDDRSADGRAHWRADGRAGLRADRGIDRPTHFSADRRSAGRSGLRAWIEANGRKLPIARVVDAQGRAGLTIVDADWWTRAEIARWGRTMLAQIGVEVELVGDSSAGPDWERRARRDDGRDTGCGREDEMGEAMESGMDIGMDNGSEVDPFPQPEPQPQPTAQAPDAGRAQGRWRVLATRVRLGRRMREVERHRVPWARPRSSRVWLRSRRRITGDGRRDVAPAKERAWRGADGVGREGVIGRAAGASCRAT